MESPHRLSTTGALVGCLIVSQLSGTAFASQDGSRDALASSSHVAAASDDPRPSPDADASPVPQFTFASSLLSASRALAATELRASQPGVGFRVVDAAAFAEGGQYGRRFSRGRRNGAAAAVIALGAVASITGGAILVYANRPECSTTPVAGGCGYGTKVVGGAVLSAGIVGLVAGALAWR